MILRLVFAFAGVALVSAHFLELAVTSGAKTSRKKIRVGGHSMKQLSTAKFICSRRLT